MSYGAPYAVPYPGTGPGWGPVCGAGGAWAAGGVVGGACGACGAVCGGAGGIAGAAVGGSGGWAGAGFGGVAAVCSLRTISAATAAGSQPVKSRRVRPDACSQSGARSAGVMRRAGSAVSVHSNSGRSSAG